MKRFFIKISVISLLICGCQSQFPETDAPAAVIVSGNEYATFRSGPPSRSITNGVLPEGSRISFFSSGGLNVSGEALVYQQGKWCGKLPEKWNEGEESAEICAYYPAFQKDSSVYDANGRLKDILACRQSIPHGEVIRLHFSHLFSQITVQVSPTLNNMLRNIRFVPSKTIRSLTPENGDISYDSDERFPIQMESQPDGNYTFLVPAAEKLYIDVEMGTKDGTIQTQIPPYNFQSGRHYICRMKSLTESAGIYTAEDFIAFTHLINGEEYDNRTLDEFGAVVDGKMTYRLQQNIRFSEEECARLLPIGLYLRNLEKGFEDTFDGQGHTLSNLTIHPYENDLCSGLFGYIAEKATVKNLTLADSRFAGEGYRTRYAALLAGENEGLIDGCRVTNGSIEADNAEYIGGLAGVNLGTIRNSAAENISITAKELWTGCLTAINYGGIKNCYAAECDLGKTAQSGGLCFMTDRNGSIENCYVYRVTPGKKSGVLVMNGGTGTIQNCYYDKNSAAIYSKGDLVSKNLLRYDAETWETSNGKLLSDILNEWVDTKNATAGSDKPYAEWSDKEASHPTHLSQEQKQ